jgi:hypothetical protein
MNFYRKPYERAKIGDFRQKITRIQPASTVGYQWTFGYFNSLPTERQRGAGSRPALHYSLVSAD